MIRRHQFPEQPLTGFRYCVIPVALSSPLIPFSNATALTVPQAALPSLTTLLSILPFEPFFIFIFLEMVFWDTFLSILLFYVFARPLDSAVISKQHFSSRSSLNTLFLCPRLRHMAAMLVLTLSLSLFLCLSLSLSLFSQQFFAKTFP